MDKRIDGIIKNLGSSICSLQKERMNDYSFSDKRRRELEWMIAIAEAQIFILQKLGERDG